MGVLAASSHSMNHVHKMRLNSKGHGEIELNLGDEDSNEVFVEIERYDSSWNYPVTTDRGFVPIRGSDESGVTVSRTKFATNSPLSSMIAQGTYIFFLLRILQQIG